jgi:hypothetical protein
MLPEIEGAVGEEAWRLREFCRSPSPAGKARATLTLAAKFVLPNSGSGKFGLTMP